MTTLTMRPSALGVKHDYDKWDDEATEQLANCPALLWCEDNGIQLTYVVLTEEVETLVSTLNIHFPETIRPFKRSSKGNFALYHDEHWVQINFESTNDALLFNLTWL